MLKKTRIEYATIHFPILNIDTTYKEQHAKVIDEYNEFRNELFKDAEPERLLHELQDVFQAYTTQLFVRIRPLVMDDDEARERVIALLEHCNQEHRKKIERYRADRGWQ